MEPIRFNIPAIVITTLAYLVLHTIIAIKEYQRNSEVCI